MKLCSVTSLFKYYPLPEALRTIAEAGYDGVEIWGGFPHAYTPDIIENGVPDPSITKSIRSMLTDYGLAGVAFLPEQCFYPVNFLINDAPPFDAGKLRQRSIAYFKDAITVTGALELPKMLVTTPFWGWQRENGHFVHSHTNRALPQVIEVFGELADHAAAQGVTLVLEPLTFLETTAVETLEDLLAVLDGVNSNHLVAMLDTGHINVTARALGKDPIAYFQEHVDQLGGRLQHMHIDDNMGDADSHLNPGEGNFDFKSAYDILKASLYEGYLSAELIMFGPNPVPYRPLEVLKVTREHIIQNWGA
ncbi:sugar phosphate isomerase/epimerase [Aggregatilineales bacterium SYSU G02658]